jgi:hypothetical protein
MFVDESLHGVTGVAAFVFSADVGDQRLGALHFDFEGGNQRIFCFHDNVARLPVHPKTDGKLHLRSPAFACVTVDCAVI